MIITRLYNIYYTCVKIFNFILRREDTCFGARRSKDWRKVRAEHLRLHPYCAVCGKKKRLISNHVHHCVPFWKDNSLELSAENLITLCRKHHFLFGHYLSWHSFNENVIMDSDIWKQKIQNRP